MTFNHVLLISLSTEDSAVVSTNNEYFCVFVSNGSGVTTQFRENYITNKEDDLKNLGIVFK